MEPVKGYEGVIQGDVVMLTEKVGLPEGTPVLVFPQSDPEEWLTRSHVAQLFAVPPDMLDGWVQTGEGACQPNRSAPGKRERRGGRRGAG